MEIEYFRIAKSPCRTTGTGFNTRFTIYLKGYYQTWNQALEAGGMLVAEDVEISIELELVKQPEPELVA